MNHRLDAMRLQCILNGVTVAQVGHDQSVR
jgi:hypothetical protein